MRRLRSAAEVILRDMPPPRPVLGISTEYRPASDKYVVSAAPLVPRSSLTDLNQDDLATLDDLLDLIMTAIGARTLGDLGQRVAVATYLGDLVLAILAFMLVVRIFVIGVVLIVRIIVLIRFVFIGIVVLIGLVFGNRGIRMGFSRRLFDGIL